MCTSKQQLRAQIKQRIAHYSAEERKQFASKLCQLLIQHPRILAAQRILVYAPLDDEIDICPFIQSLWQQNKDVFLPRVATNHQLSIHPYQGLDSVQIGAYHIQEPTTPAANLAEIDLIIVPGRAFTTNGQRLGRGGGYYDWLLHQTDAYTIGVAFPCQILQQIPTQPHDKPVNEVITIQ